MSGTDDPLEPLRPHLTNRLPSLTTPYAAGVVGDHPSLYSRSPALWNAAFAVLELPVTYLPFDVSPPQLESFLAACRATPALLGFNVTVPYKERTVPQLARQDDAAAAAGAVNLVLRSPEGDLTGSNTDGSAALEALRQAWGIGSQREPEIRLLLLGAGGAARAVGSAAAAAGGFRILLCARQPDRAATAAAAMTRSGGRVDVVEEEALDEILPEIDLIVNATPVGMAGPLRAGGGVTWLEPFSSLAPARPPLSVAPEGAGDRVVPPKEWRTAAWPFVAANLELSLRRALRLRAEARMLDLVYAPPESVALKHLRWTGHPAQNGEAVLILQAVEAFLLLTAPLFPLPGEDLRLTVAAAMRAGSLRSLPTED